MKKKKNSDEFELIQRLNQVAGNYHPDALTLGIGDDAAAWNPSQGCEILLTSDLVVEGVHFSLKTISAWQLGVKALAASLSDIAAMGGVPRLYLVSLAIPVRNAVSEEFLEAVYHGMKTWGDAFGAHLAGGDVAKSPGPLMIDVTVMGEVEKNTKLVRSGAKAGDWLCCTGNPGDSAAGLALTLKKIRGLDAGLSEMLKRKHLTPLPRIISGRWLRAHHCATACIDISDGIAGEAGHIAQQSNIGIEIDAGSLPLSASAIIAGRALRKNPVNWALRGGEDYELLFTVPDRKMKKVMNDMSRYTGTEVSVIGKVTRKKGLRLRRGGKLETLEPRGFVHF